jgi:SAM-dependent methyltransferase
MASDVNAYVHGYSDTEHSRLLDQAHTLSQLLHQDTRFPAGSRVLEAGCGVGAQTVILAAQSPDALVTSIDISANSLNAAIARTHAAGLSNVTFLQADVCSLPFENEEFDHAFVCFVLEHLTEPVRALTEVARVLKTGGTLTAVEGDHGSAYYHPRSREAQRTIECLVELQSRLGGNALIGRELYPLLRRAGFEKVRTEPRVVYADPSRPEWVDGFTRATFIAMVQGVKTQALQAGLLDEATWNRGIAELLRTAGPDGTFSYTFFKAVAHK